MKLRHLFPAALLAVAAHQAQAAVIIDADNFDDYTSGPSILNFNGFDGSTVVNGTIDLVRNGDFGISCAGNTGYCLDLDGSTNNAGDIVADPFDFEAGTYTLSFDLSGNQRSGAADTITVTIGSLFTTTIANIAANAAFQTFSNTFVVDAPTTAQLTLSTAGGDNVGPIFDNFMVTFEAAAAVPEPAALGLVCLGVLGIAAARRRRSVSLAA